MREATRELFNGYLEHQASLNGIPVAHLSGEFTVAPTPAQNLETAIQESSDFLKKINILGVYEPEGEAILLGVNGTIAGRTNTAGNNRRHPPSREALSKNIYACKKTDFDSGFPYALVDQWAKFPDFQTRLGNAIAHRQGLDRIMIGFHGTSVAVATNRATYPLLQDVNVGWLHKMRTDNAERVISEVVEDSGKVTIGKGGDYANLDSLVFDAVQLLDPWHRAHPELVVVVSRSLMHARYMDALGKASDSNVEDESAHRIITRTRLGGLPIVDAPFFPDGTVLITTLSNLSIYFQNGTRRRHVKDEPEYNRIADYQSSNEAYVIEDYGLAALVENITAVEAEDDQGQSGQGSQGGTGNEGGQGSEGGEGGQG